MGIDLLNWCKKLDKLFKIFKDIDGFEFVEVFEINHQSKRNVTMNTTYTEEQYKGFKVSEIDGRYEDYDKLYFTNGKMIQVGQAIGNVEEEYVARIQIRETIKSHLEKEKEFLDLTIRRKESENVE